MTSIRLRPLAVVLCALIITACAGKNRPEDDDPTLLNAGKSQEELLKEALTLYRDARERLESSDYSEALQRYDHLKARFPFSDFATQAELEGIYAHYRSFHPDEAISAADRFMRDHPRDTRIDYVLYVRGLTNFQTGESAFEFVPGYDPTRHDMGSARRAFDDFAQLVQRYPDSRYAADARQRMLYLRNRLARHELHVVDFYVRRGAFVAASRRAEEILSDYPGSPASYEALALLERSYNAAGLKKLAAEARALRQANSNVLADAQARELERKSKPGMLQRLGSWLLFWRDEEAVDGNVGELPEAKTTDA